MQLQAPSRTSGETLGHHTPREWRRSGMISGRGHGKDSKGLGPQGQTPHTAPHLCPHRWTRASRPASVGQEAAIVLLLAQSYVPFRHYFWPLGEAEEKAKKGVAVLGRTLSWKRVQGMLGQRRPVAITVGSKDPVLKRSWQGGCGSGDPGRGHRWGPPAFYTHSGARKLQPRTHRERGTASWVPPTATKLL